VCVCVLAHRKHLIFTTGVLYYEYITIVIVVVKSTSSKKEILYYYCSSLLVFFFLSFTSEERDLPANTQIFNAIFLVFWHPPYMFMSSCSYLCVLIRKTSFLLLVFLTTIFHICLSSCACFRVLILVYICPHTPMYVSSFCCMCVLILRCMAYRRQCNCLHVTLKASCTSSLRPHALVA
jgi:hypothetical protein